MTLRKTMLIAGVVALSGCSFYARGKDDYRKAVRNVLDRRSDDIETCYRTELKGNDEAQGKVTVAFDVEPKTGKLVNLEVVENDTTASAPLQRCVLGALDGLKLEPPDQRKGEAKFTWSFSR